MTNDIAASSCDPDRRVDSLPQQFEFGHKIRPRAWSRQFNCVCLPGFHGDNYYALYTL